MRVKYSKPAFRDNYAFLPSGAVYAITPKGAWLRVPKDLVSQVIKENKENK
jgi:hypothetical protein